MTRRTSRLLTFAAVLPLTLPFLWSAQAQDAGPVARVNGEEITAQDLELAKQMYAPQLGQMPEDAMRSVLADALIELKLVADAARKTDIANDDEYKKQMAFFEAQTLRSMYLEEQVAKNVTDAAVRAAYDQQIGSIPKVQERRLRHVLLGSESDAVAVIEALNSGTPFVELAKERSLDEASKASGGDLGFIADGQLMPEIEAAAAQLQPGKFTQAPVSSAFGFHVVMLEEVRDRPAPAFETVAPQIRQALEASEERRIIAQLREAANVEKLVPDVAPPEQDDGHQH